MGNLDFSGGLLASGGKKEEESGACLVSSKYCVFSVTKSCLNLYDPMDCSPPGSSVHGISQARILEWVVISSSRGSSRPRVGPESPASAEGFFTTEPLNIGGFLNLIYLKEVKRERTRRKEGKERSEENFLFLPSSASDIADISGPCVMAATGAVCLFLS